MSPKVRIFLSGRVLRMRGAHFHGHHPSSGRARPRSVSASDGVGTLDAARKAKKAKEVSQDHGRRSSNDLFFDAVGKVLVLAFGY